MTPHYSDDWLTVYAGDCRAVLATLPAESVHCVVTSPPYWGLRDYGEPDQLGLEPTPEQYVENMVSVFREVRRVLRDDGTLWLNLGDSYASDMKGSGGPTPKQASNVGSFYEPRRLAHGLKPKDLVGIPNRSMRQTLENFAVNPGRNIRSVWTIPTQPYPGAHFAVFPPKLVEPCIKAGTSERGVCPRVRRTVAAR